MIRMGRSNKSESSPTTTSSPTAAAAAAPETQYRETYSGNSGYQQSSSAPMSRSANGAMTESESIGRDIKEGRLSGFVGYGTVLTGETSFQAMLRVDGHLTGRVTSENGTLIVGSSGRVDANIMVLATSINGTVNGDIIALEKVELGRTARVIGNIQTPRLIIEDGAIFEGSCSMLKAQEALEQRTAQAQAQINGVNNESESETIAETYQTAETDETDATYSEAAAS